MNIENNSVCCGCLCSDRRMIELKEQRLKQCFFQIIDEFTELDKQPSISLCWECNAQVDRFTRFKEQIKLSYNLFREYIKQQKPVLNLQEKPKLSCHRLYNINTLKRDESDILHNCVDVIKIENNGHISPEPIAEDDFDNTYGDTNSDDDKLVDISKGNVRVKKKVKRKKVAVYKEIEMGIENFKEERKLVSLNYVEPALRCEMCIVSFTKMEDLRDHINKEHKMQKSVSHHQKNPKLSCHIIHNINITNSDKTENFDTYIDIKTENNGHISPEPMGDEFDNTFSNSDDEKLIDVSRRNTKVKKKKVKRKELELYKEVTMSLEDLKEERRLARMEEDYVNAMFRCERCILSFPNAEDLTDHIKIKHELNSSQYKCGVCECSFGSEVSYNYHTNKHTRRYQCNICSDRFNSKKAAVKHFEYTHYHSMSMELDFDIPQPENGHTINETEDLNANSTNQPAANYPCEFCDKIFSWKTSLRKHLERHRIETGEKRKPYCESCRLSFTTTSNLQKHVKASSKHQIQLKLRKLKAESLPDASNPEKHQVRVDQIRSAVNNSRQKYSCPQCDKKFQWRGNLQRHVDSHLARAKGELVCKPCNRTFSSIATYKQHMKISKKHVSENDFKYMCSDCGKRFANKTRLKDHVNWEHLKNYVHTCDVCQKVFKSHTSLYLHRQVVHKKDNAEHLCDHCGKPFPNHAKLRTHITAVHSGTSAYKCATCGASFSWHSCLSRHVRKVHANRTKVVT